MPVGEVVGAAPVRQPARCVGSAARRTAESPTLLVEAVGHDLRSLAAAVSQLLADSESASISGAQVRRYFGGRAEVTSFAVADATLAGRTGVAMEQLRWALSTGVAPVLVTSAFASGVRGLGRLIGAPHGLREGRSGPRGRRASLEAEVDALPGPRLGPARTGHALQAVATADAQVKGAPDDAEFALEQLVLAVASQLTEMSRDERSDARPRRERPRAERPVLSGPTREQTRSSVCWGATTAERAASDNRQR